MHLRDMRRYNVTTANRPFDGVMHFIEKGYFDFDAPYQRGNVWTPETQAALIDSLFSGLGIPAIFVREREIDATGPWLEVIDGKQRLTALHAFYSNQIAWQGRHYRDFDEIEQRIMANLIIPFFTVSNVTDEECWEIFRRVNFCGVPQDEQAFEKRKADRK